MSNPVIQFRQVKKSYGDVVALNELSFAVPARGCLGLLGPNGAGKTTAIKALLGIARVDSGQIDNQARRIGYLPQQPALFGWMTAEENLRFVAQSVGVRGADVSQQIDMWLDRLGLSKAKKRRAGGFSGGMKQRLGLAAAMIQDPDVLVLDEPVSALDPVGRHEILLLVTELKQNRCVIMSTHILDDAERVCDDVVIMRSGVALLQERMSTLRDDIVPRYYIELAADRATVESVRERLAEAPWAGDVAVHGSTVSCLLAEASANVPQLLTLLGSLGLESVTRIEKSKASLEDIFLQVVSRA